MHLQMQSIIHISISKENMFSVSATKDQHAKKAKPTNLTLPKPEMRTCMSWSWQSVFTVIHLITHLYLRFGKPFLRLHQWKLFVNTKHQVEQRSRVRHALLSVLIRLSTNFQNLAYLLYTSLSYTISFAVNRFHLPTYLKLTLSCSCTFKNIQ